MIKEEIVRIVEFHTVSDSAEEWNFQEIFENIKTVAATSDELHQKLRELGAQNLELGEKKEKIVEYLGSVLREVYEARERELGEEKMRVTEREVLLRSIDILWMDHLDQMEHLRNAVRLRAYGQRDPLVEYKNEGSRLFRDLQTAIRSQVVNAIFKVGGAVEDSQRTPNIQLQRPEVVSVIPPRMSAQTHNPILSQINASEFGREIAASRPKEPNRNAPCSCGSGKKYKRCHGA